jgi:predicted Zn-dependent protease
MAQGQLNFSREMEREADRIGLQLMTRAGFAPSGMAAMFEKLDYSSRLNDGNQFPYLRSHPLTIERISEARLRASNGSGARPVSPLVHVLMQTRARALMDTSEPALRRLQTLAAPGSPAVDAGRIAMLYGGALASLMLREFDKALDLARAGQELQARYFPGDARAARPFSLLRVEAYSASGGPREALTTALKGLPPDHSRPVLLAQAQAALALRRAADPEAGLALRSSIEALQTWVTEHKHDVLAWQALGQCAEAQGLRLRSLRAGAEASAAGGDVIGAVERFRMAQHIATEDAGADYLEAAIIQTRLRDMEAERRKLMAEMRGERRE